MGGRSLILLDTHVLIWLTEGKPELGKETLQLIDDALTADNVAVAAITFWEIAMLQQRGRVQLSQPVEIWRRAILDQGILELPLTGGVGIVAAHLPGLHPDPADRFITATALLNRATLVTADKRILDWSGALERQDARG